MARQAAEAAVAAYAAQNPPRAAPEPAKAPEPAAVDPLAGLGASDLIEAQHLRQYAQQNQQFQQNMQAAAQQLYTGQITQWEQFSRMQHPDVYDRYGKEVQDEIERRKQWKVIDPADYAEAVNLVKGRHMDEFLQPKVEAALQNAPPGTVGAGGEMAMPQGGSETPDIPDRWKPMLVEGWGSVDAGVRAIHERLAIERREYGYAPTFEEYLEMMDRQEIARDDKGWKTENLVPPDKLGLGKSGKGFKQ